ncbi:MAG: hypothetical protein ACX930_14570 [Erythrobacter sp.]
MIRTRTILGAGFALALAACGDSAEEVAPTLGDTDDAAPATCDFPPANGAILVRDVSRGTGPHTVEIANAGSGNTIVNVRDGASGDLVVSFFVAESETARVADLPDGRYRIQYATGGELAGNCRDFARVSSATQDPEVIEFEPDSAMTLTYELTPVAGGNFEGQSIDRQTFAGD